MHKVKQSQTGSINFRDKQVAIIGMGVTGRSCAAFLLKQGAQITAFDKQVMVKESLLESISKLHSPDTDSSNLAQVSHLFSSVLLEPSSDLNCFDYVVLSPGVNPKQAAIVNLSEPSKLISDLDIFAAFNTIPCIGVTGSNGKSTVVDMLHQSLNASGLKALLGGNFGTGALDLLGQDADYIVLELSSFQLDITQNLPLAVACILNITEDHIDRHESFAAYKKAKQAIFARASYAVVNRDDLDTFVPFAEQKHIRLNTSVSAQASEQDTAEQPSAAYLPVAKSQQFYQDNAGIYLNGSKLIGSEELKLALPHMMLNMQFVLAIHLSLNLPLAPALKTLKNYSGLPHRFEIVREQDGLVFINDSKATNPGACLAALSCAQKLGWQIILLAGGDAKGADLSSLSQPLNQYVSKCFVFGKDANAFKTLFTDHNQGKCEKLSNLAESLSAAISFAHEIKRQALSLPRQAEQSTIAILLSPACASTDMFKNYMERGEQFTQAVSKEAA